MKTFTKEKTLRSMLNIDTQIKLEELEKELDQQKQRNEDLQKKIEKATEGREETDERKELLEELGKLEAQLTADSAELEKFRECDPVMLRQKQADTNTAKEAANRWTENIFNLQSWVSNKFGVSTADFNKNFGIPEDLDTVD
ncbi:Meiotic nuclear division protein 1 [Mycoemilia scoparia]|uniref:Meiotic nuclear division protein 1 n=1 Tax=Mycoemilia scoparia TaxID=417184 RepID=A0A9W8ABS4_9FUNG|nr:Meiotic nuclear division protein 1 [Mycoemilia scoparia]